MEKYGKLTETILMIGHKIRFHGKIWKIIAKLSELPLLIWSTEEVMKIIIPLKDGRKNIELHPYT